MVSPARVAERRRILSYVLRCREARRKERDERFNLYFWIDMAVQAFVLCDVLFICMINKYASEGITPETVPGKVEAKMDLKAKTEILESNTALVVKYVHNGMCFPKDDHHETLDESQQPCTPCPEQKSDWSFSIYQFGCMLAAVHIGYRVSERRYLGQTN